MFKTRIDAVRLFCVIITSDPVPKQAKIRGEFAGSPVSLFTTSGDLCSKNKHVPNNRPLSAIYDHINSFSSRVNVSFIYFLNNDLCLDRPLDVVRISFFGIKDTV